MGPVERAWRASRADWRLHLLSIFSVAVAFVCLAAALLIVVNVDGVQRRWSESGRASVYLRPSASPEDVARIEQALRAAPGVVSVKYVSADDARRDLLGSAADPTLAALPPEAFPASLEVRLADEAAAARLERMGSQLQALPSVEAVETYRSWSDRLGRLLSGGVTAALLLALVVLGAVASVVSSTIRLALQRRRVEVEVLKLVGATDSYVRSPYLVEGAAQGALGALLALGLVGALYGIVRSHFDAQLGLLLGVTPTFLPWAAGLGLVALGGALGVASAWLSLRRLLVV